MGEKFTLSTDKSKLDTRIIHRYLSKESYWAKGRTLETVQRSIDNSLCFGVYGKEKNLVGFGRVVTDHVVFAYIMDVFILEEHRGMGLGKRLIEHMMNFPTLKNLRHWQLTTADAHKLYERYGFTGLAEPEKQMEKTGKERC